jgi:excisionase family DNA binding protein
VVLSPLDARFPVMPAQENASTGLLTVAGAAAFLSTSNRRVFELIRTGSLAAVRDGQKVKILASELERYVADLPAYEPVAV